MIRTCRGDLVRRTRISRLRVIAMYRLARFSACNAEVALGRAIVPPARAFFFPKLRADRYGARSDGRKSPRPRTAVGKRAALNRRAEHFSPHSSIIHLSLLAARPFFLFHPRLAPTIECLFIRIPEAPQIGAGPRENRLSALAHVRDSIRAI